MTSLAESPLMARSQSEALLLRAVPWLLQQQMPTGELLCQRREPRQYPSPYPYPLLTALAAQALTCLDPRSGRFVPALYDCISTARRKSLTRAIVTLRWRMRGYLAYEEDAACFWRLHGRTGSSPADLATTAAAAMALLEDAAEGSTQRAAVVQALIAAEKNDAFACLLGMRFLLMAGACDDTAVAQTEDAIARTLTHPAEVAWAMHEIERDGGYIFSEDLWHNALSSAAGSGRMQRTFSAIVALERNNGSVSGLTQLTSDPVPPWSWEHESFRHHVGSPAATLCLLLNTLGRALLSSSGEEGQC